MRAHTHRRVHTHVHTHVFTADSRTDAAGAREQKAACDRGTKRIVCGVLWGPEPSTRCEVALIISGTQTPGEERPSQATDTPAHTFRSSEREAHVSSASRLPGTQSCFAKPGSASDQGWTWTARTRALAVPWPSRTQPGLSGQEPCSWRWDKSRLEPRAMLTREGRNTCRHTNTRARACTHICSCTQAHAHTHTHAHTCSHSCTLTRACTPSTS